jgi:hypothetical protein
MGRATLTTQHVRAVKAMQTDAIRQRMTLQALLSAQVTADMADEVSDAIVTVNNHIEALQHILDRLAATS